MENSPELCKSTKNQWSPIGRPLLILIPIALLLLGLMMAEDLQQRAEIEANTPSVELLGLALASLAFRICGVVLLWLSVMISMKKTPPESLPNIFKRR